MVSKASQGPAIPKDDGDGDVQNSMVSHTVANQAVPVGESKLLQIAEEMLLDANCRPDTGQLLKILIQKLKEIEP